MADIVDRATRSRMMSGIRGKDTKPERLIRSYLYRAGLRFRLHSRTIAGRPDIVLPGRRVAVFVHGCFWHRHAGCSKAYLPKSNIAFWHAKFEENVRRDRRTTRALRRAGWRVLTVWECQTSERRLERLAREIRKG